MSETQSVCGQVDSPLVDPKNWVPSPNFGPRKDGVQIDLLLLHYTATPTNSYALELLTDSKTQVSSHYLIDGEGTVIQMVREADRAWHAGEACWGGEVDINSCSIGIEIQNLGASVARVPDYGRAQIRSVIALCQDIIKRHNIHASRVLGHSDVAPGRKQDPGAHFNWQWLYEAGVGLWVEPEPINDVGAATLTSDEIRHVQQKLKSYGYSLEVTGNLDERTYIVIQEFQRHFRPEKVDGVLDHSTIVTLDRLIESLGA